MVRIACLTIAEQLHGSGVSFEQGKTGSLTKVDALAIDIKWSARIVGYQLEGIETVKNTATQAVNTPDNHGIDQIQSQQSLGGAKRFGAG